MSVEILTVSLSEESIDKLAQRVASLLSGGHYAPSSQSNAPLQSVTPPAQNTHRTQTAPVSQPPADDWSDVPPPPEPPQQESNAKRCQHGEMRYVAAGFSKATNKPYPAFWGCPAPRGQQQCKGVPA